MIALIKKHFGGFVAGILGTATFLYFIDPIMKFVAELVIRTYGAISETFVDSIFAYVSQLETLDYAFYWTYSLFLFIAGVASGGTAAIWFKSQNEDTESDDTGLDDSSNPILIKSLISFLLVSIATYMLIFSALRNYQYEMISNFQYHMRIVAPYIDDQQQELLISRWSLMESEDDFDKIYAYLNEIAENNKVELKENRIY
jgi:hypothetical protein